MSIKFIPDGKDFDFPSDFGFTGSGKSSQPRSSGSDDGTYLSKKDPGSPDMTEDRNGGRIKKAMGGPIGAPPMGALPPPAIATPPMNGQAPPPGQDAGGIMNRATISMPASDAKSLVTGATRVGALAGARAQQLASRAKGRMGPPQPMAGPPAAMQSLAAAPPGTPPPAMARGGHLTTKQRDAMPKKEFALPGGRYPINDANHARNALARVSGNGSPAEKAEVRSAVHRKFPGIK